MSKRVVTAVDRSLCSSVHNRKRGFAESLHADPFFFIPTMKTILRAKHSCVQIDRRIFEDPRLSWKAKGLLSYLFSCPDDSTATVSDLINHSKDGRDSVNAILTELEEFGYVTRDGATLTVHEKP